MTQYIGRHGMRQSDFVSRPALRRAARAAVERSIDKILYRIGGFLSAANHLKCDAEALRRRRRIGTLPQLQSLLSALRSIEAGDPDTAFCQMSPEHQAKIHDEHYTGGNDEADFVEF